ncbi:ABC transporter substrate-binding protein [Halobacterium sp. KA-6]|uniref:ABC transporter substrate-binding protein n=1 Tax=Halobacterium sp. KA-6 TaxID=2896368 RepID=UPI001E46379D|nr:ABC transporter substrate-binding protein [Halobacterium sp. KA-6]MCD2204057.1 ABC transporter substrate-binding protein [Halobacterium sp. KA-6]
MVEDNSRRTFLKATIGSGILTGLAGCGQQNNTVAVTPTSESNADGGDSSGTGKKITPAEGEADNYEPFDEPFNWVGISRDSSTTRYTAQNLAKNTWEQLGITFNLQPMKLPPLFERWTSNNFDVLTLWWVARASRLDPYFMLYFNFHSKFTDEGENMEQYVNPKYDDIADKFKTTYDREERKKYVYQAQDIIARDQPGIHYWHTYSLAGANNQSYSGWNPQIGTQAYWNMANLTNVSASGNDQALIWASTRSPTAINPMSIQGNAAAQATKMIYERLVRWTANGTAEPWAADEIIVQNGTTIDVRLKEGLTHHDGEPFTAEDVKFTLDYYNEYSVPYLSAYYGPVEGVDVQDELTARFHLSEANSAFQNVHLSQLNILPKHIWDGVVEENGLSHPRDWSDPDLTGNGPFELDRYESGGRIVYSPYENYQLADFGFDQLVWNIFSNQAAAVGAVQNNQAAFVQEINPNSFSRLQDAQNVSAVANPSHGASNFWVQNQRDPFNDVAFRQALSFALDRESMINTAMRGRADPSITPIAPANEFWYNPDVPSYSGGVERAIEVLKEAGYRWNDNGQLLKPIDRFSGDGPPKLGNEADLENGYTYTVGN